MIAEISRNNGPMGPSFLATFYDNDGRLLTAHVSRSGIDAILGDGIIDSGVVSMSSETAKKIFETLLDCLTKCQNGGQE